MVAEIYFQFPYRIINQRIDFYRNDARPKPKWCTDEASFVMELCKVSVRHKTEFYGVCAGLIHSLLGAMNIFRSIDCTRKCAYALHISVM